MKKIFKDSMICFLILGALLFTNTNSSYSVSNDIKLAKEGFDFDPSQQCVNESEVIGVNPTDGSDVKLSDLKAILVYYYGDTEIEKCDNPNLNLLTAISACELEGWYYDKALTQKVDGTKISDALGSPAIEIEKDANNCITNFNYITNIYAKCKTTTSTCPTNMDDKYTISYVIDGTTISKQDAKAGENPSILKPTKEGYVFDGWYTDASLQNKFSGTVTLTKKYDEQNCATGYKDVILYGKWVKSNAVCDPVTETFTVIYNTNGGNKINSVDITTSTSADDKISIPVRVGYEFKGWYLDEGLTKKIETENLKNLQPEKYIDVNGCVLGYKDINLYAAWNQKTNNPDTSDNIVIYFAIGLVLLIGSVIITKKLTDK